MDLKEVWLKGFKEQWKKALAMKFSKEPELLETADMKQLSGEMFGHSAIKAACEMAGVTAKDIEQVLSECRDELLKEAKK